MRQQPLDMIELLPDKGLELHFAISDDSGINVDLTTCAFLVAGMQVLSVDDITDFAETPKFVDHCKPRLFKQSISHMRGNCSCAVNVTHFTTFGTVDAEADGMMQAEEDATCLRCEVSQYNDGCTSSQAGTCIDCPAGTESPAGSIGPDQCIPCPENHYSLKGQECQQCHSSSISPAGSTSPDACVCGPGETPGETSCEKCPAGKDMI